MMEKPHMLVGHFLMNLVMQLMPVKFIQVLGIMTVAAITIISPYGDIDDKNKS